MSAALQPEAPAADDAIGATLDPADWSAFRVAAHRAVDALVDSMADPRRLAGWRAVPGDVRDRLGAPFTAHGVGLDAALDAALADVVPYPLGNAHPRFWGWVHGSGVPAAILGDMLAAGLNANNFGAEQSAAYVELAVVDWARRLIGYPTDATGLVVSGGSMANLIGLAVARNAMGGPGVRDEGLAGHTARLVVYASSETHASVRKGLELLGLGSRSFASIPVRDDYSIDLEALRQRIAADRARGWRPIAVVGNAGTVNTGALDPLDRLADLAAEERLWFHVDAAIGAMSMLTERGRAALAGIDRADSVGLDLHKWLYMPYECGMALVRRGSHQSESFRVAVSYLARVEGGIADGPFRFNDHGLQLSRGDKALKVWLALRALGTEPFRRAIDANLDQARHLARRVEAEPELELLAPAATNIVCFRYRPRGLDPAALDAMNRRVLVALQEEGIAFPSATVLRDRFAIRVSITNHRTTLADLDALVEGVLRLGRREGAR